MPKKKDNKDPVKAIVEKLLSLMGISSEVEVGEDKEDDTIMVNIKADKQAGLIIGNRGRTLNAIQLLVNMVFRQKTGEWRRIVVDVSEWREKERERLTQLALQAAERAKTLGEPQALYNLSSAQRRIVHLALSGDPEVKTESLGEGKERYLVISPKK